MIFTNWKSEGNTSQVCKFL